MTSLASGATATVTRLLTPTKTLTLDHSAPAADRTVQPNKPITLSHHRRPERHRRQQRRRTAARTRRARRGTIAIIVPSGAGNYTVKAYVTGCSGSTNRSNNAGTSVSAAAGTTHGDDQHDLLDLPPPLP